MPNIIDENGLQLETRQEIFDRLATAFRNIYGQDIVLDQNSPDGQALGIFTQEKIDLLETAKSVYDSFNPDRAVGRQQDERYVINNIERGGGTFTTLNIDVTVDRTVTLQGLDENFNRINAAGYTVQDNSGTQFILIDTVTITAGTHSLPFRAKDVGEVQAVIGTIQTQTTVVLGVTGINNPSAPINIGRNTETDAQFRVRRQRSVALNSSGYINGLEGLILSLDGVTDARLYENYTNVTDVNGIPPHCIWVIAEGGSNADIGNAIYSRKTPGTNMKGDVEFPIITPSSSIFTAKFDRPESENLYIQFEIKRTNPTHVFSLDAIKDFIAENVLYKIGQFSETSVLTSQAILAIDSQGGGGVPINMEISDDGYTWVDYLDVPTLDSKWVIDSENIEITVV